MADSSPESGTDGKVTELRESGTPPPSPPSRFTPGTVLADRYRIVAQLGKGGMGEVYRAEDLKLGQQVALKFLPREVGADPHRIERLYHEVRIGRQISHPNVCRLYDIGEWSGHHFLAMEYVDGEDLASLLRRIGKLPENKALDITRDICAGLAAAHVLGVVHRDLKPANIMIDGRGVARITDFGLADLAAELLKRQEVSGTPAYMAPEQLRGEPATGRADLYALGLILFEVFTGKRRFEARTYRDLLAEHSSTSHTLTSETRDLDPTVQRVILRCLEEDPERRPPSIHSVIAALPGGDPLQAAMDAGETPSPEMVAASGAAGDISVARAWMALGFVLLALGAVVTLAGRVTLYGLAHLPKSPAVLTDRARDILRAVGHPPGTDSAIALNYNQDFFEHVTKNDRSVDRWNRFREARPGVLYFTYRESPQSLVAWKSEGKVWRDDPPNTSTGMAEVQLDTDGRLIWLSIVPPEQEAAPAAPVRPDWKRLFDQAQLDSANFREVRSLWRAPTDTDSRYAWTGHYPNRPSEAVRVEAGAWRGRPVWFAVIGPWEKPRDTERSLAARFGEWIFIGTTVIGLAMAGILARNNYRRGSGNRKGAFRLALFLCLVHFASGLVRVDHVADLEREFDLISTQVANGLYLGGMVWLLYLAIEPHVRRRWPQTLISWGRILNGRLRDPMVCRDLLIGIGGGLTFILAVLMTRLAPVMVGDPPLTPLRVWTSPLAEISQFVYAFLAAIRQGTIASIQVLVSLFLFFLVFRNRRAAATALFVMITVAVNVNGENLVWEILFGTLIATTALLLLTRFGLLALTVAITTQVIFEAMPLTFDTTSWYFGRSSVTLIMITALAVYGFYHSLGGKPPFGNPVLDEA